MNRLTTLHLGVIGTALASLLGIIACTLTHTAVPEGLTTAATTAIGGLVGITVPLPAQPSPPAPQTAAQSVDYGLPGQLPAAKGGSGGQA